MYTIKRLYYTFYRYINVGSICRTEAVCRTNHRTRPRRIPHRNHISMNQPLSIYVAGNNDNSGVQTAWTVIQV